MVVHGSHPGTPCRQTLSAAWRCLVLAVPWQDVEYQEYVLEGLNVVESGGEEEEGVQQAEGVVACIASTVLGWAVPCSQCVWVDQGG